MGSENKVKPPASSINVCKTQESSVPVAGSNVIGCNFRVYLSLQPFPFFDNILEDV